MEINPHYKYIHLVRRSVTFGSRLAELLCDPELQLQGDDHLFIATTRECYEALLQHTPHAELYAGDVSDRVMISHYASRCDWLFAHGLESVFGLHKIKRAYRKKVIWRTWGHDVPTGFSGSRPVVLLKELYVQLFCNPFVRDFRAVGGENRADEVALRRCGIRNPFHVLGYPEKSMDGACNAPENKAGETLNIMVGHSALDTDRHFDVIEQLKHFTDAHFRFYFPISYGDPQLAARIKSCAAEALGEARCVFLEKEMPFAEYRALLQSMHIAILAGVRSYALGNVELLLSGGKTLFLTRGSVLAEACLQEGIPHRCVDELDSMDDGEFANLLRYEVNPAWTLYAKSYHYFASCWKECLEKL